MCTDEDWIAAGWAARLRVRRVFGRRVARTSHDMTTAMRSTAIASTSIRSREINERLLIGARRPVEPQRDDLWTELWISGKLVVQMTHRSLLVLTGPRRA